MWIVVLIVALVLLSKMQTQPAATPIGSVPNGVGAVGMPPPISTTNAGDPSARLTPEVTGLKSVISNLQRGNVQGAAVAGATTVTIEAAHDLSQLTKSAPSLSSVIGLGGDTKIKTFYASLTPVQKVQASQVTSSIWAKAKARGL